MQGGGGTPQGGSGRPQRGSREPQERVPPRRREARNIEPKRSAKGFRSLEIYMFSVSGGGVRGEAKRGPGKTQSGPRDGKDAPERRQD